MQKMTKIIAVVAVLTVTMLCIGAASATGVPTSPGPAPNSGDCIPDGSGLEHPETPGMGPAPNSGDGIPDGSGF